MANTCTQIGPLPFHLDWEKLPSFSDDTQKVAFLFKGELTVTTVDFRPGSAEIRPFCFKAVSLAVNSFPKHTGRLPCCALLIRASVKARHPDDKQSVSQNQAKSYPGPTPCNPSSTALWRGVVAWSRH